MWSFPKCLGMESYSREKGGGPLSSRPLRTQLLADPHRAGYAWLVG
jgi:hypothetical protein